MAFENPNFRDNKKNVSNEKIDELSKKISELESNIDSNTQIISEVLKEIRDLSVQINMSSSLIKNIEESNNDLILNSEEKEEFTFNEFIPSSVITESGMQRTMNLSKDLIDNIKNQNNKKENEEIVPFDQNDINESVQIKL